MMDLNNFDIFEQFCNILAMSSAWCLVSVKGVADLILNVMLSSLCERASIKAWSIFLYLIQEENVI